MAQRRSIQQANQEAFEIPNHHFLTHIQRGTREYRKLGRNSMKEIEIPVSFNWGIANEVGLDQLLEPHMNYIYTNALGEEVFLCEGWQRMFNIVETIYRELVLEFYSTIEFETSELDLFDNTVLTFRLGGVPRQCSVVDLARRIGIYTNDEIQSPYFHEFMESTLIEQPEEYNENAFWHEIANGVYEPSVAREIMIRSPVHRALHRLITSTITHKKGVDKVPSTDLYYLWTMITPGRHLNLPYALASYLSRVGQGRASSPLTGGHFITRLAASYNLRPRQALRGMQAYDVKVMTYHNLVLMNAIRKEGESYVIPEADERPEEPERRQRRRRAAAQPEQPQMDSQIPDMINRLGRYNDDIRGHLIHSEAKQDWIAGTFEDLFNRMNFAPRPPYPAPYPHYPDWNHRSQHHDEAGPSGPHDEDMG